MDDLILPRRSFVFGLAGLFAAPAIIKVENLMALRPLVPANLIDYKWIIYKFDRHTAEWVMKEEVSPELAWFNKGRWKAANAKGILRPNHDTILIKKQYTPIALAT
jgi:hypothetical protein